MTDIILNEFDGTKTLRAIWTIDSETGERVLMCEDTGEELWRIPNKV